MTSLLLTSLLSAGCGASRPAVQRYTLSLSLPAAAGAPASPTLPTLLVRPLAAREPYEGQRMVYRTSPYRVDHYNYHQWDATPGELVTEWTLRYLRHTGQFAQVMGAPGISGELVLSGVVRDFEEVDEGATWQAVLGVDLWLSRAGDGKPLWFRSFHVAHAASKRNPEAIAAAMSHNLEQVLQQVSAELPAVVQRLAPSGH